MLLHQQLQLHALVCWPAMPLKMPVPTWLQSCQLHLSLQPLLQQHQDEQ